MEIMSRAAVLVLVVAIATGCGRLGVEGRGGGSADAPDPTADAADPDLLAYWPLDEAAGATVFADRSRFASDGDCANCPVAGVTGVRGTAIEVGPMRSGIHIAAAPELASWVGPLTIAAWVRMNANDLYSVIVSNDRDCCGTWDGFSLWASHYSSGPALVTWSQGDQRLARGTPLPLATWKHLVGTFDGTVNRIYVDGTEASVAASMGYRAPSSFDLWIGTMGFSAPDYHLEGAIDEVMIWKRALSPDDVAMLYPSYSPP